MTIDAKIAAMRIKFYKQYKRTPTELHIGQNRVNELRDAIPDLFEIADEELFSDARVYGMRIVRHQDPDKMGVAG